MIDLDARTIARMLEFQRTNAWMSVVKAEDFETPLKSAALFVNDVIFLFTNISYHTVKQILAQYAYKSVTSTWQKLRSLQSINNKRYIYFNFFFGRSWLVLPHFFLRQLVARGGSLA